MTEGHDEAAYLAGKQAVVAYGVDLEGEALRQARAYLATRSFAGSDERLLAIWSFFTGLYDAMETDLFDTMETATGKLLRSRACPNSPRSQDGQSIHAS